MASKKGVEETQEAEFQWGNLPLEVQITVLGWLPLRSLFRLKPVCKLWNTAISARSFIHFPSLVPSPSSTPWLIFFTPKSFEFLLAFDFDTFSWFKFDVGFLSSMLDSSQMLGHTSSLAPSASARAPQRGFIWCTGSTSGLLLLDFQSSLHVCNPLTKSLLKLPLFRSIEVPLTQGFSTTHLGGFSTNAEPTDCRSAHTHTNVVHGLLTNTHNQNNVEQGFPIAAHTRNNGTQGFLSAPHIRDNTEDASHTMHACSQSQDYTVVVIGKAKTALVIEAYCASTNSWDVVGSMPTSFIIRHDQMMECNGLFYSLLLNPIGMLVVGENNAGSNWRIQAMPVNYGKETCRLVACQNAIFMVCSINDKNNSLVIWRFQPESRLWIKMLDMPDHILEDVKSISCSNWVDCVGVGNFICFRALCCLRVLTYDLCEESWSWLPEPAHKYDSCFARGLQFEPRLDYRQSS